MNIHKLIRNIIKSGSLAVIVYFSAALAIQINLGGDVEYWLSLFIAGGIMLHGVVGTYESTN